MGDGGKVLGCSKCKKRFYQMPELLSISNTGLCKACAKEVPIRKHLNCEQIDTLLDAMYILGGICPNELRYSSDMIVEAKPIEILLDIFIAKYTPEQEERQEWANHKDS